MYGSWMFLCGVPKLLVEYRWFSLLVMFVPLLSRSIFGSWGWKAPVLYTWS